MPGDDELRFDRRVPIVDAPSARWFLTALDGARAGTVWPIAGTVTIGRLGDIPADGPHISRTQVRLRAAETVRARAVGQGPSRITRPTPRALPRGRWHRIGHGTVLEAGIRLRLDRRPRRRSKVPWIIACAVLLLTLLILIPGPPWRWALLLVPALFLSQAFRRKQKRLKPLRSPLAVLISSHEGRAFHTQPHVPVRALRGDLAGSGWTVASEEAAIWLAGYLAVWNDPDVLAVTSPWITTSGTGLEIVFGEAPPTRDSAAVTWEHRPQWALPLRLPRECAASARWAAQLNTCSDSLPPRYTIGEALEAPGQDRMAVALAHDENGPVIVDLASAPHALVAGTTGSGKSELLTSWLLLMASRLPPSELTYVLIDFKGGATSGALAGLPHLVSVATDLEPAGARRIVASLRAVLRQREQLLAAAHARDISELTSPPARLVIVVDEFRALADDVPDALDQLVRLAAQGRSLGVHLILATQRPGGAVTADMRANMPLRVALRTTESADSHDLIGLDTASRLPRIPGRAVLLDGRPHTVQIAWTPDPARTIAELTSQLGGTPPAPPWLPPLPERVTLAECGGGIALLDRPDQLRRESFALPPSRLLVMGAHGAGLTTAARTCAAVAWLGGEEVWLVSAESWAGPGPGFGGTIHPRQTRLVQMAIAHALARGGRIVIDDVEDWSTAHDSLHGIGSAESVIERLLRSGGRAVLLTREMAPRWGRVVTSRIHLAGLDRATAALAGLGREEQEMLQSAHAGRAVIGRLLAQFALPEIAGLPAPAPRLVRTFAPLPETAPLALKPGTICLGHDGVSQVRVPAGPLAVVGPRGSGRTETAQMIASQLAGAVVLESPPSGTAFPQEPFVATASPEGWASAFGGVLGNLKEHAPLLLLRPDLCPRVAQGIEDELEPGHPGYAILLDGGRARALRLARLRANEGE